MTNPEMTAGDVAGFVRLLDEHGIPVCIDGGWGVDALLGGQTRPHSDLDIAVEHKDVPRLRALLEAGGYTDVPRDDTRDCNFVLGDAGGHQIDIHSYTFDAEGKVVFGVEYPFESLQGTGRINGLPVRCITPEWMVKFHTGYPLDEGDYHDVRLLCERFGIEMPPEYAAFETTDQAPAEGPPIPQLGEKLDGIHYINRPGVYALIRDDEARLAVVRVNDGYFLPGGGIDPGETYAEALAREVLEETGCRVSLWEKAGEAVEYIQSFDGRKHFHVHATFVWAQIEGKVAEKVEDDHELLWLSPAEALERLERPSHIWAVQTLRGV